jgi:hypothetical protein
MTCSRPGCPPSSCCCNGAPTYNHLNEMPIKVTRSDRKDSGVQKVKVIVTVSDVLPPLPWQFVYMDMPVVFFHPGLNRLTRLSSMDLTTSTGMLYTPKVFSPSLSSTWCSNWTSSLATAHIFDAASGQHPAGTTDHMPHPHPPPDWLASLASL